MQGSLDKTLLACLPASGNGIDVGAGEGIWVRLEEAQTSEIESALLYTLWVYAIDFLQIL